MVVGEAGSDGCDAAAAAVAIARHFLIGRYKYPFLQHMSTLYIQSFYFIFVILCFVRFDYCSGRRPIHPETYPSIQTINKEKKPSLSKHVV